MNAKDTALHLSAALQEVQREINHIEHELYTTKGNREKLVRLRRVRRALDRDLKQVVVTLNAPLQLPLSEGLDAPLLPPPAATDKNPSKGKRARRDPVQQSVDTQLTLPLEG